MSRNVYPDSPKKPLIVTKGSLQKELEDFGLNSAVVPTRVTLERPNRDPPEAELHTKPYAAAAGEPSASSAWARPTRAHRGLEQGTRQRAEANPW